MLRNVHIETATSPFDPSLPMEYIVLKSDGIPRFTWQDRDDGNFFCGATGDRIANAKGAVSWFADRMR